MMYTLDVTPDERILIENFTESYFSKDWNGLMPVVEKIESLNYYVWIQKHYCEVFYIDNNEKNESVKFVITHSNSINKIESTYKSAVFFIKWFNEHKK